MDKDTQSLIEYNPILAKEWHPTKNKNLKPCDVSPHCSKKVWWMLRHIDERTGNVFDFEWEATINSRAIEGNGCPYIANRCAWKGYNDLATVWPNLAAQWHPTKNGALRPEDVCFTSSRKVWWLYEYDDPKTKKHFEFEWEAQINSRAKKNGTNCPYLSSNAVYQGYNDLATTHPYLIPEFHTTKNGDITPYNIAANSSKKIWWILHYDDPITGKHFDFEWEASPSNRVKGRNCPYLSNQKVWVGFNDLLTVNPELASEWDFDKNDVGPQDIVCGTEKTYYWRCKRGHSWKASPYNRHYNHSGCPICFKEKRTSMPEQIIYYYMKRVFPDAISGDRNVLEGKEIDVFIPSKNIGIEYDGRRWHNDVSKTIEKDLIAKRKSIQMIHVREKGLPELKSDNAIVILKDATKRERDMPEIIEKICSIVGCQIDINIDRDMEELLSLIDYQEKINSLEYIHPDLAKEWHPTKNGNLTPNNVTVGSQKKVWWQIVHHDEKLKRNFVFEWQDTVDSRAKGNGCPYLSNHKVYPGFNDLATNNPQLALEWNYNKNNGLKNGKGEDISTPDKISTKSSRKVWWKCSLGHEWETTVDKRNTRGFGCPICAKLKRKNNSKSKSK